LIIIKYNNTTHYDDDDVINIMRYISAKTNFFLLNLFISNDKSDLFYFYFYCYY